MSKKAEDIRETLIKGASSHKIAERVVKYAQKTFGNHWRGSAIVQLSLLLKLNVHDASALISEHCTQPIRS